jgi:hypothetical protein
MNQNLSQVFSEFFESENTGGLIIIACTILSIAGAVGSILLLTAQKNPYGSGTNFKPDK